MDGSNQNVIYSYDSIFSTFLNVSVLTLSPHHSLYDQPHQNHTLQLKWLNSHLFKLYDATYPWILSDRNYLSEYDCVYSASTKRVPAVECFNKAGPKLCFGYERFSWIGRDGPTVWALRLPDDFCFVLFSVGYIKDWRIVVCFIAN